MPGRTRWAHVAIVAGSLAAALAVPASAAGTGGEAQVIELTGKRGLFTLPQAPTVGVAFLAGGELLSGGQTRAGESVSTCAVAKVSTTVPPAASASCTTVFRLADGDLHLASLREYANGRFAPTTMAVLGGTGKYSAARGEVKTAAVDGQAGTYKFTITLVD